MDFLKTLGASLLAWIIGFGLIIFGTIALIVGAIVSLPTEDTSVSDNSVLYIDFTTPIVDAPATSLFSSFDAEMNLIESVTMLNVFTALEYAAEDSRIKGICISASGDNTLSLANIEELRHALKQFKRSGKFIVAFDDSYSQSEYYLSTVADTIIVNPEGSVDWRGVGMSTIFYKNMLDKLGISVDIFRPTACKYKSAVEPFFLTKMSDANRKQNEELVESIWQSICEDVAIDRGIEPKLLKQYAKDLSIASVEDALNTGMVDMVAYEDTLYNIYKEYGVEKVNKISLGEYISRIAMPTYTATVENNDLGFVSSPMVAIIYADGEIVDGNKYQDGAVYGSRLANELRAARLNSNTKAVVVRVNSPGGSALASEIAWYEMKLLQEQKPVVISMGGMAASGGYYISAPADYILADKVTLTGSIGVFGVLPNFGTLLEKRLGITFDSAATSASATGLAGITPLTAQERKMLNKSVDKIYTTFTQHVAEGRNLPIEDVLNIAEGRVWSGTMAKEIGLVDEIGGLHAAITKAVSLADIERNFKIYEYVAPRTPFEEWLNTTSLVFAKSLGVDYDIYGEELRDIVSKMPILTSMSGIRTQHFGEMNIEF
ncbi:MAG: signal peptide peptidase SppA [Alistipes sp.]|nr:signal peptide peptidase SppA [Alistipes sp.]